MGGVLILCVSTDRGPRERLLTIEIFVEERDVRGPRRKVWGVWGIIMTSSLQTVGARHTEFLELGVVRAPHYRQSGVHSGRG